MSQPIIQVSNLSKRYRLGQVSAGSLREDVERLWSRIRGHQPASLQPDTHEPRSADFWALRDVSFEVRAGEVLGIIGRNGAGKSTLLKILSRITQPTSGEAILHGRVASLLEVGTGFHPELSGRENVFLNGAILGMKKAEVAAKFDEIVEFSEVGQFIDTPVKRYSSGMYVRLAFAVAAHLEPEILIVDEVLAVGDVAFQRKCLGKMQDVSRQDGRTILFVSHSIAAIQRLCTKCLVISGGQTGGTTDVETAVLAYTGSHLQTDNEFNVLTLSRDNPQHGIGARITGLTFVTPPRYGGKVKIIIDLDCLDAFAGSAIGVGFDTIHGQRIATIDTDTSGEPIDLPIGSHRVELVAELMLHPGIYSLSCGLMSGNHLLDYISPAGIIEIASGPKDKVSDRGFAGWRPEVHFQFLDGGLIPSSEISRSNVPLLRGAE